MFDVMLCLDVATYLLCACLSPNIHAWFAWHEADIADICRGRMLILYNIAPDLQRMSSWVWRLRILSWLTGNKDLIKRLQSTE